MGKTTERARLWMSQRSPFARRARLALRRCDIAFDEEVLDVFAPPPRFLRLNPLGLVPTLELGGGAVLSDSPVILDWIDEHSRQHGGAGLWPTEHRARAAVRQASVLAAGAMGLVVSAFVDRALRKLPDDPWLAEIDLTLTQVLDRLGSNERPWLFHGAAALTQAGWDTATLLEYLDLRRPAYDWRRYHLGLVEVLDAARRDEFFRATTPKL